jgi:hypothetical protein
MSAEFQCDRCRSVQPVRHGLLAHYTLSDGRSFFAPHQTAWCPRCLLLTEAEMVPDPGRLAEVLEGEFVLEGDPEAERLVARLTILLEWARTRRTPAKCLRCWGSEVVPLARPPTPDRAHTSLGPNPAPQPRQTSRDWGPESDTDSTWSNS